MVSNNNNNRGTASRCLPTVTWGTVPASKIGTWANSNGETTVVTNKKTPVTCTNNNSNNTSHLNAVVGIVVDSVAGVVVAVEEEGRWLMGIRTIESENRARFSRKEGEYISFLPGGKVFNREYLPCRCRYGDQCDFSHEAY